MSALTNVSESLIQGKSKEVKRLVEELIQEGISPKSILTDGLMPGMDVVGRRFKNNEIYVPEVLIAARAMHAGMDVLKPYLTGSESVSIGKVVIGTVKGDLHDIGKNLVCMMLEGAGFEVVDLGIDVPSDVFIEKAKEHNAKFIMMSALLTTTMGAMKDVIQKARESGLNGVKVVIGGAPVTEAFANEIGADGYAPDAASAVEVSRNLLKSA